MRYRLLVPFCVVIFLLGSMAFYLFYFVDGGGSGGRVDLKKSVISFSPQDLYDESVIYDKSVFSGRVSIVNVFASWCVPCIAEHEFISRFGRVGGRVQFIGLNWRDERGAAKAFLSRHGNPYDFVGYDSDGGVAIDWGVRGIPETYLVDSAGVIRYHYVGPILSDAVVDDILSRAELLQ